MRVHELTHFLTVGVGILRKKLLHNQQETQSPIFLSGLLFVAVLIRLLLQ